MIYYYYYYFSFTVMVWEEDFFIVGIHETLYNFEVQHKIV